MEPCATGDSANQTVRDLIEHMARTRGQDAFLISPDTGRILTFAGLQVQSAAISARLRQLGLKRGDKVAFMLENGLFTVQLFLGTVYAGMVSVPLNVRAGVSQLAYTLDHSDAKIVFVEDQYLPLAREALAGVSRPIQVIPADVDAFTNQGSEQFDDTSADSTAAEDVALLMYTSGSVGQPKAAIHSHRTLLAHGHNSMHSHQLTSADRSLLVLPIYHINAECVTLMPTLLAGGSIVVPHRFSVSQYWDLLDEHRCTWSAVVPTIIAQLLDWKDPRADSRGAAFERIRFIRSSSAPLSPAMQREFMARFKPLLLIQAMGSSECGNVFSNPLPPGENKIGTPGLAWGFETRIVGRNGTDVMQGEPGEVLLRGPAIAQGYYKDAEATAAALDAEGWLHTGDLAYQDEDGYFFVIGRSKELIIKGGMNIAPRQIDDVLESHPAVLEAAVVGVPDYYLGEDLVAFAVLRSDAVGDEGEMLAFCESRLGHFKTPTRIHFVPDLPKGPSGKVQRLRLVNGARQPAADALVHSNGNGHSPQGLSPASNTLHETIAQIWTEVLRQPEIDPDSNFFALGGDSLMAIQCLSKLRERLGVALSASDFFENPTVAQQAAFVKPRLRPSHRNGNSTHIGNSHAAGAQAPAQSPIDAPAPSHPIAARGRNLPYHLSSGQQRIWFFNELVPDVPLYNESESVRLTGDLDADALDQALNSIVARHEILRTTIQMAAQRPIAIVHETSPLTMKRIDLSTLPHADREAELARLLIDEPRRPYRLDQVPGIRATLVRIGPADHVFILMMHHMVCDWASEGVLWRELSAAYQNIRRGAPLSASRLPIQYGDYAVWQQQRVDEAAFAEDLDFWEENLRGAPQLLELPSDRPRPTVQSFRGARRRFRLGATLTEALRQCSRREKTSLFTVFAAALDTLLYRYSGSEDILLGIPLGERERDEMQSVIGFLIHTQALRTRLSGSMTFRELLAVVQKGLLGLYSHREVPFDQVVNRIRPDRNLSYSPLFQVMINWRDRDQQLSFIGLDGLAVESMLSESRTSKFDLTLILTDDGDDIWLEAEYSTDLFDHDRIARMFSHYQTLLESVAINPGRRLADLPLLTDTERQQLLVDWNNTDVAYPIDSGVHQLFEQQAERTPHAVAAVFADQQVTYAELNRRSNNLARHLQQVGVNPGALVAICVDRSIEMLVGLLGILKAGAAYVPLDPGYPNERLAFMLRDSGASLILTQSKLRESLPADCNALYLDTDWPKTLPQNAAQAGSNPDCDLNAGNLAYVIYTSGSTGQPKGVEITHRSVVNLLCSMSRKPGMTANDTLVAVTTLSFDIAALELFLPLSVGAKLVIASRDQASNGALLLEQLIESRATVIQATPVTFRMLIEAGWKGQPAMKVLCGGEELPRDLANQILVRSTALWNMYGPTETTIWSSTLQVEPGDGPVPIGQPIDNTQFHILDAAGKLTPIGVAGELHIGGSGLARAYFNRPDLTAEKFVWNDLGGNQSVRLYKTGDLVRRRADGNIDFLGRLDNQVKLRGLRIELGEIEARLRTHPGVGECVVTARTGEAGDKQIVAYIAPERDFTPDAEQLRKLLRNTLPEYMVPAAFVMLEKLPLTPNGKIDRKALPAPELNRSTSQPSYVAPRTPIEEALAEIWRTVLGLKQIGVRDDFFALGGHSLQATRLINEIRKSFDHKLSVPLFFQNPTIEGTARVLSEDQHGNVKCQSIPLSPGSSEGTLFFLDAGVGLCRLARRVISGPASFATAVGLPAAAFRSASVNRLADLPSLESLAAAHVNLIRARHTSGPCLLAGYSFGGVLAFEVAHQLEREGIHVKAILLLDSWARAPLWWEKLRVLSRDRDRPLSFRARHLLSRLRNKFAEGKAGRAPVSTPDRPASPALEQANVIFGEVEPGLYVGLLRGIRRNYQYRPLDSRAILFRCQDDLYSTYAIDGKMGWGRLFTQGIDLVETPGDHSSLLQDPHLQELAERIDYHLKHLGSQ
jgi:amino acid adenylation domain-containing protein